ncbi:cytochrome c oxidase subunit VIII [Schizosaccharomyces pombe]|uniref:Cytochrome c oxidase polypeptide VIII, mitochondrial n=1 Tax=Schizosaccharomyces pombe (strain 972 / ATCC 24843) TaxID=284812 RepID=COX8_SCHPO|nr:putative cytochrome c oxidase subunit VIII [Schizosaccharomyces pombe]Q9P4W1.1 RecName: Full=Cytochrome c oxidase polypeptide VIII, mitochondrial; Flags: Precursor [Schizosaccharomyces pombe 972h-]8C8Q_H Chain H, Cytochrome c oxidase polypeptide VIII, mitochondrial [Schizosaccharomyces pombe]8Q1B_h Chain h, Cytochrome c oxidase polypeptide VIII, mitochondrial [Schizosaccharomyces pombe]CAB71272.1 cytochrome c oxidase subunit VIII (predicted) [Schizosaccharomyces pombe]|eukprot:NP_594028.1 putative cytochrome c oxidase subunit VIII [Schizosaccharomyces pombe]
MLRYSLQARSALRGVRFSSSHSAPKPGSTIPFYINKKPLPTLLYFGTFGVIFSIPFIVVKYHNRNL